MLKLWISQSTHWRPRAPHRAPFFDFTAFQLVYSMFSIGLDLNLLSAVAILSSVAVPVYLTMKVEGPIRKLTLILSAFVLVHAAFHLAVMFGFDFLGEAIFDPLSVLILIFFGLSYLKLTKKWKVRVSSPSSSTPSGRVEQGAK